MSESKHILRNILIALAFLAAAAVAALVPHIAELKARLFWSQLLSRIFLFILVFDGLLFLILVVLQDSKSGGLAGMLGGSTVETVMGPQSGKHLNKLTTLLAGVLFVSLFALGTLRLSSGQHALLADDTGSQTTTTEETAEAAATETVPATPATTEESDKASVDDSATGPGGEPSEEPTESTNP